MAPPNTSLLQQRIAAWNQQHLGQRIDPQAELAVASMEGLSGGIGDDGHAFGPNQLNNAGGVITGRFQGQSPEQIQQWAWSPSGIDYALAGVARAAGNETGQRAVRDIVTRFERPANPQGEITGALARYGAPGAAAPPKPHPIGNTLAGHQPQPLAGARDGSIVAALKLLGFAAPPTLPAAQTAATPAAPPGSVPSAAPSAPAALHVRVEGDTSGLHPHLLSSVTAAAKAAGATAIRITSGFRSPQHNAQVGGVQHSNHETGDAIDGYGLVNGQWVPLGQLLLKNAGRFGLRSGDVPGFFNGRPDPVHVDDGANVR